MPVGDGFAVEEEPEVVVEGKTWLTFLDEERRVA